jgi:dipeptidyl aminopeptidase/acylaminoacyl peptidase
VIETHGGPTWVQQDSFNPGAQAWLDHGFAYMNVNYHGSTTFGREFEQSIWHRPGFLETDDLAAGRAYMVSLGIARPELVFLTGGSYGGFLTLMAIGRQPDLWAGGMAIAPITDWESMYEDCSDSLRGFPRSILGGTPSEQPERYRRSSPITYAEHVRAPVLILQGRNDTRTPARPVAEYQKRLEALGKPIAVHWYDEGHLGALGNPEFFIGFQEEMLRFATSNAGLSRQRM